MLFRTPHPKRAPHDLRALTGALVRSGTKRAGLFKKETKSRAPDRWIALAPDYTP
jgi:hypothetical protein